MFGAFFRMTEHLSIRFAIESDEKYLIDWLLQPGVLEGFPLCDLREIEDAARIWMSYAKHHAVLTALWDDIPCAIANLYLQSYQKMAHQSLLAIIVDEKYRGKGVGKKLMQELLILAKERFQMEFVHLEVYEGNPAIHLYEKLGFQKYGLQRHFIKDKNTGRYLGKIMMQKYL